ncbi:DNA replication and repair protein RecF [Dysgonomonadaceae bacterium PH5-43]|nr:DNA replication and repair protein RecF [Dysgonomonadaceae bacterium PH5-43]
MRKFNYLCGMIIERISILNFKNIEESELLFSPKINCLFGNNGMGKTNLLDAIYYLSLVRSYNNLPDSQIMMHDKEFAVIQGFYTGESDEEVYCGIKKRHKKVFKRNKKEYQRLSEHIGLIPVVMISPSDIDLIQGGSSERRKFIDMILCQYDKEYLNALINYNKVLFQRNSLLKEVSHLSDESLFDIIEEQMEMYGNIIYKGREQFMQSFVPLFQKYYKIISKDNEEVNFRYESHLKEFSLSYLLSTKREKDMILGYTSVGVHKDDFDFLLDNYLIRKIGSQGQNKTFLIALKLAEYTMLVEKGSSVPILLLDDLFDKLDSDRVEQIINLVGKSDFGQIFITDTNRKYLDEILKSIQQDYKLFFVENGKIDSITN